MDTIKTLFDALVNTAWGRLFLLAIVLGYVTQKLKEITAPKGTLRAAILPAMPVFLGAPLGLIPRFLPGVSEAPIAVLLCALAGVLCAWLFHVGSRVGEHLAERGIWFAKKKIDEKLGAPESPAPK